MKNEQLRSQIAELGAKLEELNTQSEKNFVAFEDWANQTGRYLGKVAVVVSVQIVLTLLLIILVVL